MNKYFNKFFLDDSISNTIIKNGIPRFTSDSTYSSGNFSILRERHRVLQFDSKNGTNDRLNTILERTGWPPSFFAGKDILECGCGAGPDTEILLELGAHVLSIDLVGLDIAKENLGNNSNSQFVQASINDLPLKKESFDIVFCHRVLQHTPDPEQTLNYILQFVKRDGAVFIHSYARTFFQMFRWKYFLLPLTRRMDSEFLYNLIQLYSKPLFHLTNFTRRCGKLGVYFAWVFIPLLNYRHAAKFKNMADETMIEYAIHDTFDALSPPFDKPLNASIMKRIGTNILSEPFEVIEGRTITLLRTITKEKNI